MSRWIHTMAQVLLATLLAGAGGLAVAQVPAGYWSIGDYLERHPEQAALTEAFTRRVRGPARPLAERGDGSRQRVQVAVIYPGLQSSGYWRRNLLAFRERARELGLDLDLQVFFTGPDSGDVQLQADQLREVLGQDPDYLVYTLDTDLHRELIDRILARGDGPGLILQNITTPVRAWDGRQPLLYVGFDHVQGSRILAAHLRDVLPGGDLVILYGTDGYVSRARGGAFIKALEGSGLRIREGYVTDFLAPVVRRATRDALARYPELKAVIACATDMALVAAGWVEEAVPPQRRVLVTGWGGGSEELAALEAGRLAATVMRMNDDAGVAMAEAIALDVAGKGGQVPTVYAGDMVLVTRQTPAQVLRGLEARAFRYSGRDAREDPAALRDAGTGMPP
ncbi:substrate-binding domain-containing protein [Ectothiorhodospira mobilis]|uniref:substrate-binding domain-containing protein n=1 Tax=Ectothiorhodospira mobilis TaxID=195064 RepID=UPI0019066358|nr:substrate-binding domain-containing protein [Ectothiorhodospira mobilis]MBK1690887.1 hypothetical protein [Ectothiorhodospira mobilis]